GSLQWVAVPTKQDGKGRRRLLRSADGPALFGAWNALLQIAARCPTRGTLADQDGPLDAIDLEDKTDIPAELFNRLFQLLTADSQRICWLEVVESAGTTADNNRICRDLPGSAGTSCLHNITGQDRTETEHDKTEQNKTEHETSASLEIELDRDSDSDSSTDRALSRQRWLLAIERFWAKGAKQRNADRTDTFALFDEQIWPPNCRDRPDRLRRAMECVETAARNGRNKMAYLKTTISEQFAT
ncbi:MAG TPA: hypothetical protein VII92_11965, partial [Anaerolineae bacterium]